MTELAKMISDSATKLFADTCTEALRVLAEQGEWQHALWDRVADLGLTQIRPGGPDEEALDLVTLVAVAGVVGAHAVPLPLMENLLARRALVAAGMDDEALDGPLSIVGLPANLNLTGGPGNWRLSGRLARVPWGRNATAIVASAASADGPRTVVVMAAQPTHLDVNCAHEPRDTFDLSAWPIADEWVGEPGAAASADVLSREGALIRAAQLAGAMRAVLAMTVQYARERVQFGRPIAQFQAIQHQVVDLASQAAASQAAVLAAALAGDGAAFEAGAAKLRASEAAGTVIAAAHQVHGAMGFTYEHPLHFHTRRLMAWRDEFGNEAEWARWIGEQVACLGGDHLWAMIVAPEQYRSLQTGTLAGHA